MFLSVSCHSGRRGEETPRSFVLGERTITVTEVLDQWHGPDHRWFKVLGSDGTGYVLRRDDRTDSWELAGIVGPGHALTLRR